MSQITFKKMVYFAAFVATSTKGETVQFAFDILMMCTVSPPIGAACLLLPACTEIQHREKRKNVSAGFFSFFKQRENDIHLQISTIHFSVDRPLVMSPLSQLT